MRKRARFCEQEELLQIFSLFIFRCVRKNLCNTPKMPNNGNIGESSNKYSFEYGDT